ncbi:DUF721 domain-containing protein [Microvirga antarctica]|uniref:DUF721 domain-containing protein n=1 Tax=Microvirga antarctica TaxID=2819233 RepID=UPI001B314455|nr:DciA family protein [Microvirga antarctica]
MRKPRPRAKPLADFLDLCLGPSLARQGFATSDIIVAWPEIVGERLAAFTQPLKIEWKRKGPHADPDAKADPATLVVRTESAFALEMQHLAPIVIERVNTHYGWRCIGRLILKQGPVQRTEKIKRRPPSLSDDDRARIAAATRPIAEDGLRSALDRLGVAIVGDAPPRTKA